MRHLLALTAAATALVAAEAHAQVREVVLFPAAGPTLARKAAPQAAPLPVSMEARTLNWPGKRESRYSPRASARPAQVQAPATAPAPLPAVYAPQAAAPTPFIYAPVYAPAYASPVVRPAPAAVYVPAPRVEAPRPAPTPVVVAAPVRPAPPAFVPMPAQIEAPALSLIHI